uniref:Uncharacterized protein n=1 Tax=Denticeps clupeoides TaxID=299321 RepID=A0AAY4BV27_9TELE
MLLYLKVEVFGNEVSSPCWWTLLGLVRAPIHPRRMVGSTRGCSVLMESKINK